MAEKLVLLTEKKGFGVVDGIALSDADRPCICLLYTSPSPRDRQKSRMPSSA